MPASIMGDATSVQQPVQNSARVANLAERMLQYF